MNYTNEDIKLLWSEFAGSDRFGGGFARKFGSVLISADKENFERLKPIALELMEERADEVNYILAFWKRCEGYEKIQAEEIEKRRSEKV